MLPVGDVGHDLAADVGHDVRQGLRVLRGWTVQAPRQVTRLDGWEDGVLLDALEIVGHDVRGRMQGGAQLGGGHVTVGGQLCMVEA